MTQPILLSSLRPDPRLEAELRWYFNAAAGEMGLHSNWEAYAREGIFMTRLRSTFSVDIAKFTPDLRGAHRATPIMRALQEITADHRGVLAAAFTDVVEVMKAWPGIALDQRAELVLVFRELTGLVPFSAAGEHRRSRSTRPVVDWLLRIARRAKQKDQEAIRTQAAVVRQAETQLAAALKAYAAVKRSGRR